MNKFKSVLGNVFLALSLSGCMGVYEEGFDCPPGVGVGCKSISHVNTMVNQGLLPRPETDAPQEQPPENLNPSGSCKNCSSSPNASLPSAKAEPPRFSIWWAPQWEESNFYKPINLTPVKG